jgi:DNA-binding CsgD family transcriptional regulator
VSPSTIKSHVKSVYRKLGVSSRKEAVEQAHARKLI